MRSENSFTAKPPLVREALSEAVSFLKKGGIPQPRLEGELLLSTLLNKSRTSLLADFAEPLTQTLWERYQSLLQRRAAGYPLQYLTGKQEFMSLEFLVTPDVLIPRSDTEVLVEKVLSLKEIFKDKGKKPSIIDVGTGSGAIAVSLAYYWREASVSAVDISLKALEIAKKNAERHGVKMHFAFGDLLTPFNDKGKKFDIIVSNPPYIATGEIESLPKDVQQEPILALDGGLTGLDYYQKLIPQAIDLLAEGGILVLEIGWDQGLKVKNLLTEYGFDDIEIIQDYGGRDRVVLGRKE